MEQISLHCSEGTLDWLYPKGALRLTLTPRLAPVAAAGPGGGVITACVKPSERFHGAQLYLERDGLLELLVGDRMEASPPPRVRCFSRTPGQRLALFLQATLHQDISRRTASFRYELRGGWTARMALDSNAISREGESEPEGFTFKQEMTKLRWPTDANAQLMAKRSKTQRKRKQIKQKTQQVKNAATTGNRSKKETLQKPKSSRPLGGDCSNKYSKVELQKALM